MMEKNARESNTQSRINCKKITTQDLTWFGNQLQPTSTPITIRFSFYPVAR